MWTGSVELPAGTEMVMPGDNIAMTVTLIAPIAMDEGLRFAIREGGRTVGAGVVSNSCKIRFKYTRGGCSPFCLPGEVKAVMENPEYTYSAKRHLIIAFLINQPPRS